MRTAKESGSGGVMKEEIFVLMEFCYLPELVTLMLGCISPHSQHCQCSVAFGTLIRALMHDSKINHRGKATN